MTPRQYQSDCIAAIDAGFEDYSKQLLVLPTGGGKTCVFSWLAKARQEKGQRTLILAHREELIQQASDKLFNATAISGQIEKAENYAVVADDLHSHVVIASVQTLMRDKRLARWPHDYFSLVVIDEAHRALADSYQKILAHFDGNADVLGVTATPDRGDKKNLGSYFENIAYEIGLFDLIHQGFLSPISVRSIPLEIDLRGVKITAGDFDDAQLGHALEPYLDSIAAEIAKHAKHRKTLCFLPLIATSQKFVEACCKAGIRARHIDGNSPDRAEILAAYSRGEFDLLSNAVLLTEGYDEPTIDCVCVLRPTQSRALYSQMVGRGTRVCDFKSDLLLLDFLWQTEKHKLSRPAHLIAKSEDEADTITELSQAAPAIQSQSELGLEDLASKVQAERERRLREELKSNSRKSSRVISADQFAAAHDAFAVVEYSPTMRWESGVVSEQQAKYLKQAKIDLKSVRDKGHAKLLLDLHFRNQRLVLATPKQVHTLKRMGFANAETMTKQEACRAFASMRKK